MAMDMTSARMNIRWGSLAFIERSFMKSFLRTAFWMSILLTFPVFLMGANMPANNPVKIKIFNVEKGTSCFRKQF